MVTLPLETRESAGRILAGSLGAYAGKNNALILALVRGGVVVGDAIAAILDLPLYPYVVRKLGHPGHREFGLGAIAEGGSTTLDEATMLSHGTTWNEMEPVIDEEMQELNRRKAAYAIRPRPDLAGKTVILTDDGAATGSTMLAAIQDMEKAKVKKVVVALPVCPPHTAKLIRKKADQLVTIATPEPFEAVGKWYRQFDQVEDEEVIALLRNR